ncbi:MAG: 5-oxoprolinase subunit PxpA [Rhodocyclaceae bacterium]|nr:5-oxoprolinase subunit PxpA [Rhodocyclaceae bacterium]
MMINLNADLGESFGPWQMGDDEALLPLIDSASIACGFHAGDPGVMRDTLRQALAAGVETGAHPAYPDLQGFGRRTMRFELHEVEALVIYQLGALSAFAAAEGGTLTHVKPHGALSNQACADIALATAVARAIRAVDPALILLAPATSLLADAGRDEGLPVALEVFADRRYLGNGRLQPRSEHGAVIHDPEDCIRHVESMLDAGGLVSHDGQRIPSPIHSVCVHGDGASAVATAAQLRRRLIDRGHRLVGLRALVES